MKRFSEAEIFEIRSKRAPGPHQQTQPALALEYNCSVNTIRSIEKGLSYREVGGFVEALDEEAQSESRMRALMQEQGLMQEVEDNPADPYAELAARAEPLSISLARIREAEEAEHAQRMQGLKALAEHTSDSASDSKENPKCR